jgi:CheY-like chemotaxis protein
MRETLIVIIDDDIDDLDTLQDVVKSLDIKNETVAFNKSIEALAYLQQTPHQSLLILCDVNMPMMNGFELRACIHKDEKLKLKLIPFIFMSTSYLPADILKAYELSVQGYFKKPDTFDELKELLQTIIAYWDKSYRPSIKASGS